MNRSRAAHACILRFYIEMQNKSFWATVEKVQAELSARRVNIIMNIIK